MKKHCKNCNKEFSKQSSDSKKYWITKKFCSSKCFGIFTKPAKKLIGTKRELAVIKKLEKTMFKIGHKTWNKGLKGYNAGKKNNMWKGGITPKTIRIRTSMEYKLWREAVFTRDNWTCIWCGLRSAKGQKAYIHADHIQEFALYPELRFAIDNGRTLCKKCHYKRHSRNF